MAPRPDTILITGASGFVGSHLTPALAAAFPDTSLATPSIELQDPKQVEQAVGETSPDVCIHLAAVSAIEAALKVPDHAWNVNFHGTLNLAWALSRHAPACQMLFVSSADAYGASFRSGRNLDELAPLAPISTYGKTKAAADLFLGGMAGQGLRVIRLRPFNHTGPGQSAAFVLPSFARQIARISLGLQPPLLEVGNLDTWRDFLDVRDVCAGYIACIKHRHSLPPGTILNVASGRARRVGDVLNELTALAGLEVAMKIDQSRIRATDILRACGNATRAREVLDWSPIIPWTETLQNLLADWRGRVAFEK